MQTKDVSAELEQAILLLEQQGKQPSVALVKSKLSSNVPMPAIIAAIKNWKSSKPLPKVEIAAESGSAEERIAQLEQQVAQLTARIKVLEEK
ncbi:hypothetical protein [Vibrio sp. SCSIO 43137]|uniref:hypothetical protein n=1 Tax=Vibrio sp. SCSIO 43137 TaxID=3021011 RepID=UPI002307117C|nr:hypothetical protein [Vibrio sp. SCSIO 43137]WCE30407.1 hypothetical protein PK654_03725 [Vibrio sp. SCSIO 43137]